MTNYRQNQKQHYISLRGDTVGIISSIYNSGYNIKRLFLGEQELKLAYLGEQIVFNEVIDDLNYVLYEFYKGKAISNTIEAPVKSAILKGSTKYRDIDTGDILDTFDETKNLELVSVKMPVLTTTGKNLLNPNWQLNTWYPFKLKSGTKLTLSTKDSVLSNGGNIRLKATDGTDVWMGINEGTTKKTITLQKDVYKLSNMLNGNIEYQLEIGDNTSYEPFKSNILTVNEDVTLRSNGDVYDELNLLTGRLTQRIDENNEVLAQEIVKTVDLTIVDQDGKTINKLNSFNGTTHVSTEVAENSIYPTIAIEVATE